LYGYLYDVGGQDGVSCLNYVERYDPKENKWSEVASMNTRRLVVAVAVLGGFLYAVSGSDDQIPLNTSGRDDATELWSAESYNPNTNTCQSHIGNELKKEKVKCNLRHVGLAVVNGKLYVVDRLKSTIRSRINGDCGSP
ncbi:hypothetical protein DAPPUDRAFT_121093, partial [Daphnia pulex]